MPVSSVFHPIPVRIAALAALLVLPMACTVRADEPDEARFTSVTLSRGDMPVRIYDAVPPAKCVVLFGSGDGGWSYFERRCCQFLRRQGCQVTGIDFNAYASAGDYTLEQLASDLGTLTRHAAAEAKNDALPSLWGGWSMGAEQSVPAAAHSLATHAATVPRGLLLLAPGERGRYGLRTSDRLGVKPTGDGTFAMLDFADRLGSVRIAQFHPSLDLLDHTAWFEHVTSPKQLWTLGSAVHNFAGPSDAFYAQLGEAVTWTLAADDTLAAPSLTYQRSTDWLLFGSVGGGALLVAGAGFAFAKRRARRRRRVASPSAA